MNKASSWVALLVGVLIGAAGQRMIRGAPPPRRAPARPAPTAAQQPPQVEDPRAVYRVPLDDSPVRGSPDALVTIAVVSDFQCPFCKRVEPTLAALAEAYPGQLRFVWKHQPLPFHPQALPAAIVAEEARAQGGDEKFWAMHDKLFEIAPALERPQLEAAARQLGLDVAKVGAALDQGRHVDRIRRDQALCSKLGANGTPTMFVNGRKVVGAVPLEQLKGVVEEELRSAKALVASGVAPKDVYAKLQEKGATATVYLPGGAPPSPQAAAQPAGAPAAPATSAARVPLRPDDPVRGPATAKVTIAVFSDFQCPFCARVEPTLRQIEQAFPGAVRITWKHLPLPPTMHPQARPAAEAAEAAREQGRFWEMHDRLFAGQRTLSPELYLGAARELGLDMARFQRALEAHAGAARIDDDLKLAGAVGANATPTLFVNCRRIEGAYPFESIQPIVEEEVRRADALTRGGTPAAGLYDAACGENLRRFGATAAAPTAAPQPAPAAVVPGGPSAVPVRRDDPVKGRPGAPVTLVLFSDFQCPFCARANPTVEEIESAYPNDVRLVWKHLPLPFHPNAMPAALAAEAARRQGGAPKFWAMHDRLFSNQSALSTARYEQYAREIGLDLARFRKDMADPALRARIDEDVQLAQRLGVNGTPTFVINGERVVGANGLRPAVDRQLAQARAAR
jgi:protein-disulfide isomerase